MDQVYGILSNFEKVVSRIYHEKVREVYLQLMDLSKSYGSREDCYGFESLLSIAVDQNNTLEKKYLKSVIHAALGSEEISDDPLDFLNDFIRFIGHECLDDGDWGMVVWSYPKLSISGSDYFGVISDIFDGIIARKLNVSNEKLRVLDTLFDLIFYASIISYIFKNKPHLLFNNQFLIFDM